MKIEIYRKQIYGKTLFYIKDPEIADLVSTLTCAKTVRPEDLKALIRLGHEVIEVLSTDEPKLTEFLNN